MLRNGAVTKAAPLSSVSTITTTMQPQSTTTASSIAEKTETTSLGESSSFCDGPQFQQHLEVMPSFGGVPKEVHVEHNLTDAVLPPIALGSASRDEQADPFDVAPSSSSSLSTPPEELASTTAAAVSTEDGAAPVQDNTTVNRNEEVPDFRKARALLVQRSKANGCDVDIVSKVNRRKAKFEQLAKEERRKSGAMGLLKLSWEQQQQQQQEDTSSACGSAVSKGKYVKVFHENVPTKKSLEDLP